LKGHVAVAEYWYLGLIAPFALFLLQPLWILLTAGALLLLGVPKAEIRKLAVEQASHGKLVALINALRPAQPPQEPPAEPTKSDALPQ